MGAVRPGRADTIIGKVVDLSPHGIGVQIDRFTAAGTLVHVSLDPSVFGGIAVNGRVPVVSGVVTHCVRDPAQGCYRLGVYVARMPEGLRQYIRDAASPTAMVVVRDDVVKTADPRAREALYQAACARLDTRQPDAALRAAERALAADPENRRYQGLVHRARAELALEAGRRDEALWEVEKAWACTPRDPRVQVLRDQVRSGVSTRFARGTGEMPIVEDAEREVELDLDDVEVIWE